MNFGIRSDKYEITKLMRGAEEFERKPSQWEMTLAENAATKRAVEERLKEYDDEQTTFHGKPAKRYDNHVMFYFYYRFIKQKQTE